MEITHAAELLQSTTNDVGRVGRDVGHQAARGRTTWLQEMLAEINRAERKGDEWFTGYRAALLDVIDGLLSETLDQAREDDIVEQVTRAPMRHAVVRALAGKVSNPSGLAAALDKKPEQVSRAIRELVDLGVVQVLTSKGDKRKRPVRLSIRGRAIAKALAAAPLNDDVRLGIELAAEYHAALIAGGRVFKDTFIAWAKDQTTSDVAEASWSAVNETATERHIVLEQGDVALLANDPSEEVLTNEDDAVAWLADWAQRQCSERGVKVIFVRNDTKRDDWTRLLGDVNARCEGVELRHICTTDILLGGPMPRHDRTYDVIYTHRFTRARESSLVNDLVSHAARTWLLHQSRERPAREPTAEASAETSPASKETVQPLVATEQHLKRRAA